MANNRNAVPELIEVLMRVGSVEDGNREVRAELRVHNISLTTDEAVEFSVELDRAVLALDLDGLEIVPKSRHGEPTKQNDVQFEHKMTDERSRQGEISASAEGTLGVQPSASFAAKASGSAGVKVTESITAQQTQSLLRVKARGNLTWEVTEPMIGGGSKPLDDTYLNDDVLCKVRALPGANLLAVKLEAFARKRDLRITPLSKLSRFKFASKNHEKMVGALIAKSLPNQSGNGVVIFSVSEVVIEDDQSNR
ncbi:hypothetical protein [Bradyrhizobium sp. 17]|uniref:hypothetical protein n=1 Tax=Bradyrhizobium sp. 17 TaxID=2782649 RepID=UPI001FF929D5|nr:hypothetical protein [Bradyrhizobium sp. 17]MCK1524753.1 hypothetical protein [Bradyrhizobium sp. 17]